MRNERKGVKRMATAMKRSDSIHYLLTKWVEEVLQTQNDYKKYVAEVIDLNLGIVQITTDLQKMYGKEGYHSLLEKKKDLMKRITNIQPEFLELNEFLRNYRSQIEEIDGFDLKIKSTKKIIDLLKNDLALYEELFVSLSNLAKAINAVLKARKSSKRNIEEFNFYFREFTQLSRKADRVYNTNIEEMTEIYDTLKIEIDEAKQALTEAEASS